MLAFIFWSHGRILRLIYSSRNIFSQFKNCKLVSQNRENRLFLLEILQCHLGCVRMGEGAVRRGLVSPLLSLVGAGTLRCTGTGHTRFNSPLLGLAQQLAQHGWIQFYLARFFFLERLWYMYLFQLMFNQSKLFQNSEIWYLECKQ